MIDWNNTWSTHFRSHTFLTTVLRVAVASRCKPLRREETGWMARGRGPNRLRCTNWQTIHPRRGCYRPDCGIRLFARNLVTFRFGRIELGGGLISTSNSGSFHGKRLALSILPLSQRGTEPACGESHCTSQVATHINSSCNESSPASSPHDAKTTQKSAWGKGALRAEMLTNNKTCKSARQYAQKQNSHEICGLDDRGSDQELSPMAPHHGHRHVVLSFRVQQSNLLRNLKLGRLAGLAKI